MGENENMTKYNLKSDGDGIEQIFCDGITDKFQNYEALWSKFIVPWTNRDIYPRKDSLRWIDLRHNIPKFMEELCMVHYSIFRDLAFYLYESQNQRYGYESLRTIYTHFGHAIEMAQLLGIKILIAEKEVDLIEEDIFVEKDVEKDIDNLLADFQRFIEDNYKQKFSDYKTKQIPIIYFIEGTKKFLRKMIDSNDIKKIEKYFRSVQNYRNKFIHSPLPGTLYSVNLRLQTRIPMAIRKNKIDKYELWTDIKRAIQDGRHREDFIPEKEFLHEEFNELKQKLNLLWTYYIKELRKIYKTDILKYSLAYTKSELKMVETKKEIEEKVIK